MFKSSTSLIKTIFSCLIVLSSLGLPFNLYAESGKKSFNEGWLFSKGDFKNAKDASFNDKKWRKLDLPHDWAIEGPFDKKYSARNGGLPVFGDAWYRKYFTLPESSEGKYVSLTFDGAMANSSVYINGKLVGERPFGYIAFNYDITPYLNKAGEQNTVSVHLSPENYSARWYPGAGLYRNTWIEINDSVHVEPWGTFVRTPKVTNKSATVELDTNIKNEGKATSAKVVTEVKQSNGVVVKTLSKTVDLKKQAVTTYKETFTLDTPILWDVENPYRYEIVTKIIRNNTVVDTYKTPLGIRSLKFSADDGFWLNGRRVQIQGVCLHHDNGPLGAIANTRAIERKLEIMKEMGANSVRTSHNPPSPELVELADKMGILLQVEAFDMWEIPKTSVKNGYNTDFKEWHEKDLRDMIIQNRNNPSVIMWSSGNEVHEQKHKDGWKLAKYLNDIIHDEDPTRLVTHGISMFPDPVINGFAKQVDIAGFNYKAYKYAEIKKNNPDFLMIGTETSSVVSTRGVYHFPIEKYRKHPSKYVTSYDVITPPWAYIPDVEFYHLKKNRNVMGEYIWTGFDYIGEPTPYGGRDHGDNFYWNKDWPARSSSFGAVDLVGFKKDRFFLYQSEWTSSPMVHVLPHWTWNGKEGEQIPVMVYTNAEEVELFVNGKSQGRKVKGVDTVRIPVAFKHDKKTKFFDSPYRLLWDVEYQPGNIEVVAYTDGKEVARKKVETAGRATKLVLSADRTEISADGYDLSYISVEVQDENGNLVPDADNKILFNVKGVGEIAGVGNGDSATIEPFQANYRRAFSGKAMLIIKSIKGKKGKINISAWSERLDGMSVELTSK